MKKTTDNQDLARQQSEKELDRTIRLMSGTHCVLATWGNAAHAKEKFGTGEGASIAVVIGMRGYLSRHEAKRAAKAWREIVAQHPRAFFYPHLIGYDDDPREFGSLRTPAAMSGGGHISPEWTISKLQIDIWVRATSCPAASAFSRPAACSVRRCACGH